jgi:hypothetical protein
MRTWAGWVAAVILAAGCGGGMWGGDSASAGGGSGGDGGTGGPADGGAGGAGDERAGTDVVCAACKVTGGGQLEIAGRRVEVSVEASPHPGEDPGAAGVPATGRVQLHEVGGDATDLAVDAILSCRRESGRLVAAIAGPLGDGGRFEIELVDGGEPADDRVSWSGFCGGDPVPLANGNLQVHDLERCQPAGAGGGAGDGGGDGGTAPTDGGGAGGDGTGGGGTGGGGTGGTPGDFVPM